MEYSNFKDRRAAANSATRLSIGVQQVRSRRNFAEVVESNREKKFVNKRTQILATSRHAVFGGHLLIDGDAQARLIGHRQ